MRDSGITLICYLSYLGLGSGTTPGLHFSTSLDLHFHLSLVPAPNVPRTESEE